MYSAIGTLADFGALNILSMIMDERIANIVSYAIGVMISFFLCRKFVFKVRDHITRRTISTITVHFVGLVIQELLLDSLLDQGIDLNIAKGVTVIENGILMYFLNKYIVFRKYKPIRRKPKKVSETWVSSSLIYGYFFLILKDLFSFVWFRLLEIMWLYRYSQSLSHKLIILEFPLWLIFFLF